MWSSVSVGGNRAEELARFSLKMDVGRIMWDWDSGDGCRSVVVRLRVAVLSVVGANG